MTMTDNNPLPLESQYRKAPYLVGTPIRLLDGEEWVFPPCPLEGDKADQITGMLEQYQRMVRESKQLYDEWDRARCEAEEAGSEPPEFDHDADLERGKKQNKLIADLAHAALTINYPELPRDVIGPLVPRSKAWQIVGAVSGAPSLEELLGKNVSAEGNRERP